MSGDAVRALSYYLHLLEKLRDELGGFFVSLRNKNREALCFSMERFCRDQTGGEQQDLYIVSVFARESDL